MSDGLVVAMLVAAVLIGVGAAAFLVMRSPAFWADAGKQLATALLPAVIRVMTKRMPPEEEAEWRAAQRAGRGDEWIRKRMTRRKG
jgi:hypothetical protein